MILIITPKNIVDATERSFVKICLVNLTHFIVVSKKISFETSSLVLDARHDFVIGENSHSPFQ